MINKKRKSSIKKKIFYSFIGLFIFVLLTYLSFVNEKINDKFYYKSLNSLDGTYQIILYYQYPTYLGSYKMFLYKKRNSFLSLYKEIFTFDFNYKGQDIIDYPCNLIWQEADLLNITCVTDKNGSADTYSIITK